MRKVYLAFVSVVTIFSTIILVQCSNEQESLSDNNTFDEQQLAFVQFKADLASLNNELGYSELLETKGEWKRDLATGTADAIGGAFGHKFGGTIGISVGGAFGGFGGAAGYLIGHKYGGTIGTVLCSTVAGAIYDWVSGYTVSAGQVPGNNATICLFDDSCSIGEVHNALLSCIRSNGKQYISEGGSIMIDELYDDIMQCAKKMGIDDLLSENEEYIAYIKECSKNISDVTFKDARGTLSGSYKNNLRQLCEKNGFSSFEIDNIMDVISTTEISAVLDEPQAIEYEKKFEKIVENSALSLENKALVKTVGSISIMSNNYWNAD